VYDARSDTSPTFRPTDTGRALATARKIAVSRLRAQAASFGAEGVVGVKLSVDDHRWRNGHHVARLQAVGTAIAFDPAHAPPEFRNAPSLRLARGPFTSGLSGQEFVTLLRAGYRPIAIALGNCVFQRAGGTNTVSPVTTSMDRRTWQAEIVGASLSLKDARDTTMQHLQHDVRVEYNGPDAPAGIVGVTFEDRRTVELTKYAGYREPEREETFEYVAIGTAIAPLLPGDPRRAATPPAPLVVVPLDR
jgi:hypothetical protein